MGRVLVTLAGILVLAVIAGFLTEVTLASGHGTFNDTLLGPKSTPIPSSSLSPTPSASPSPSPSTSSTPEPTATPTASTATTNSFVHLRQGESTSTPILLNLNGGTVVQLLPISNAQWQEVEYNGVIGYIFRSYLSY